MYAHQVVKPSGQTATDTKTRILDAADEIFVRRGIDGARMQEIADQAGVNKALLHNHFRSKAQLAELLPSADLRLTSDELAELAAR